MHRHPHKAAKDAEALVHGILQPVEAAGERRVMHLSAAVRLIGLTAGYVQSEFVDPMPYERGRSNGDRFN